MDEIAVANLIRLLANSPGNPAIWNQFLLALSAVANCELGEMAVNDLSHAGRHQVLFAVNMAADSKRLNLSANADFRQYLVNHPRLISASQNLAPSGNGDADRFFSLGVALPCNQRYVLSLLLSRGRPFDALAISTVRQILENLLEPFAAAIHAEQRHKIKNQISHFLGHQFDSYIVVDSKLRIVLADPIELAMIQQMDCVSIEALQFSWKNPALEQRILAIIETNQTASLYNQCESCRINLLPSSALTNLYQWECYKEGYILVFTMDHAKNSVLNRLSEIYKLSKCEAVCAIQFMQTPSIAEIATTSYRSQETIRNHLKHIMQKMDAHSQAELMKKLVILSSL